MNKPAIAYTYKVITVYHYCAKYFIYVTYLFIFKNLCISLFLAAGDVGFNSWVRGEGNGNPLQYSGLGNPMDRGAWRGYRPWGSQKSWTQLSNLNS